MQIESKIYADIPVERRMLDRVATKFRTRAARDARAPGLVQTVTVLDISTGGFRLDGWRGLETGMEIAIELPPLHRIKARVIWIVGRSAGCEFRSRLTESELARILDANAPEPSHERPVFGRKGLG